tara:strand:- start:464 stop:2476 length:2013 start_codon:yes stop_codon:yes gene_type:complete
MSKTDDAIDFLYTFAKDNEATRKARLEERKELLSEKKDLYKQIALNRYAADDAIYNQNLQSWMKTEKELQTLKSSGAAVSPEDLAKKIATIEGRIPTTREIDNEEMTQILSPYLANIKQYEDKDGNKKFDYTGNLKPVAPDFDKYYNPDKYISAVDDLNKAVKGDWVRFVKGEENSVNKEDKIIGKLQADLEEGAKRTNLDFKNYFQTGDKYTFDRLDSNKKSNVVLSDTFQGLILTLPENDTQSVDFQKDPSKYGPNGMPWTFNKNDMNSFLSKEKSEGQMDSITFSVLKTIDPDNKLYISSYEKGVLTLKGDAELTRGQIENAYEQIREQRALQALQTNDSRYLNMGGVTRDLQNWFNQNYVGLDNQSLVGAGDVAAVYIVPNTVNGHSDPVKTAEVKEDLQLLVNKNMNGVIEMFEEKGIPLPNAQPINDNSSFGEWSIYLDAYSEGMITKQAKISINESPYAVITEERAATLNSPILNGMVIDRNVQSSDQITAENTGLFIKNPEKPEGAPVFFSWAKIHEGISTGSADAAYIFEGINEPNKSFEGDYETIKQMFNLTSSTVLELPKTTNEQMDEVMKITFDNVESFLPPEKYRFRTSIAADYKPTEELQSWASKNLPAWNNFIDNLPKERPLSTLQPDKEYKQKVEEYKQAEKYLKLNKKIQKYL